MEKTTKIQAAINKVDFRIKEAEIELLNAKQKIETLGDLKRDLEQIEDQTYFE